jgi:N-acetyltransferase 10
MTLNMPWIFKEHADFEVIKSMDPALDKCVTRINVFRRHRQNIQVHSEITSKNKLVSSFPFQYIHPTDADKLIQAELVVVDEAAAIPIPIVKKLVSGI